MDCEWCDYLLLLMLMLLLLLLLQLLLLMLLLLRSDMLHCVAGRIVARIVHLTGRHGALLVEAIIQRLLQTH